MANQIIKQPNGLYCTFSTVYDTIIHYDATAQEIIDDQVELARKKIIAEVNKIISDLDNGLLPYRQFTMSYSAMLEHIKEVRGEDEYNLVLGLTNNPTVTHENHN